MGIPPGRTKEWKADPEFGARYSRVIWDEIRELKAAGRKGRRDRDEEEPDQEPEIAPEPEDDAEDADDADEDEDDEADELKCRCTCSACRAGDCESCAFVGYPGECEDPDRCLCGDRDYEDDDDEEDDRY